MDIDWIFVWTILDTDICDFLNFFFQNGLFPVINRPTRVTKSSATVIDRIVSGLIKTDICDHFAVFYLLKINLEQANIKKAIIKRDINEDIMKYFIALTGTS